ncbi:MAG: hypothetical protein GY859_05430 [Desulfobacterales bacterium]|nr:hypothetical protein [Desulfobacterales bacterium]
MPGALLKQERDLPLQDQPRVQEIRGDHQDDRVRFLQRLFNFIQPVRPGLDHPNHPDIQQPLPLQNSEMRHQPSKDKGREEGKLIGQIHLARRLMGKPLTPMDKLVEQSVDELNAILDMLEPGLNKLKVGSA